MSKGHSMLQGGKIIMESGVKSIIARESRKVSNDYHSLSPKQMETPRELQFASGGRREDFSKAMLEDDSKYFSANNRR